MSSHEYQKCLQSLLVAKHMEKSLCSSPVAASYLGVQRQQQVGNSSSDIGGNFYLQPIFEHVILKRHQIAREDSMTPW